MPSDPLRFSRDVWKLPPRLDLENIEEVGRHHHSHATPPLGRHIHHAQRLEICYLHKGSQTYSAAGQRYTLTGGDVLLVLPGDEHASGASSGERGTLYWLVLRLPQSSESFLNLRGQHARSLVKALRNLSPRHFPGSPQMRDHLDNIIRRLRSPPHPLSAVRILDDVLAFLLDVIDCASRCRPRERTAWMDKIIRYVEEHISGRMRTRDMAGHMGLSLIRFKSRFRTEMGIPPAEYVLHRKVDRAKKDLLQHADRTITAIAVDIGFSSSQYFATVFKRYTGMTPRQFQITHSQNE